MADTKALRLYFMGFEEEMIARYVLELIQQAKSDKQLTVADWALVKKSTDGKVTIDVDKSVDPGAGRGAVFGGTAGMFLAAISGPIGAAAMVGGAVVGAAAAALKDSGLKTHDLEDAAGFMVAGRTGLVVAVPLEDTERFEAFRDRNVEFESTIRRYQADITPGQDFQAALEAYRAQQA